MATEMEMDKTGTTTLERLNQAYVDAFMNADVEWYREHLAQRGRELRRASGTDEVIEGSRDG